MPNQIYLVKELTNSIHPMEAETKTVHNSIQEASACADMLRLMAVANNKMALDYKIVPLALTKV